MCSGMRMKQRAIKWIHDVVRQPYSTGYSYPTGSLQLQDNAIPVWDETDLCGHHNHKARNSINADQSHCVGHVDAAVDSWQLADCIHTKAETVFVQA